MTTPLDDYLSAQPGRCAGCGFDVARQGCTCTSPQAVAPPPAVAPTAWGATPSARTGT